MLTLFAALKLPTPLRDELEDLQTGIEGIDWIRPDNLHITIGYFGLVEEEFAEILDRELMLRAGDGFSLRLSGIGVFGGARPHTLWAGVEPRPALLALNQAVHRAAARSGVEMEKRRFTPHVSLSYIRRGIALDELARYRRRHDRYRSKEFFVDQMILYSSQHHKTGPNTYREEATYPLLRRR